MWLGSAPEEAPDAAELPTLIQMDTNLDDMNPELFGAVTGRLFEAGAVDVWLTPVQMKKGRPGVLLSVLCAAEHERPLARLLLEETTTLGVRIFPVRRHTAERTLISVTTPYGLVTAKVKLIDGLAAGVKPEYDDCVRLADRAGVPVRRGLRRGPGRGAPAGLWERGRWRPAVRRHSRDRSRRMTAAPAGLHVAINGWFAGDQAAGSGQYVDHLLAALPQVAAEVRWSLLVPQRDKTSLPSGRAWPRSRCASHPCRRTWRSSGGSR